MSIGYLPQEGLALTGRTVFDECLTVFDEIRDMEARNRTASPRSSPSSTTPAPNTTPPPSATPTLQERFHALDGYALDAQVGAVLTGLGFSKEDWARQTDEFSGGWQMRIALAKLLLAKPNLLLLDEPTNHLDLETRNWLEDYLHDYPFGYILISHDRYFLDVTIDRTVEIWNKRLHIYQGNYDEVPRRRKDERRAQLDGRLQATSATASSTSKPSSTASATRPPRPSRSSRRIKELEKIERIEIPEEEADHPLQVPAAAALRPHRRRSRRPLQELRPRSSVFNNVRFSIERGDRVALVGVNGAGKSTLIKLLTGVETPTTGTVKLGHNVVTEYFAQDQYKVLDGDARMLDDISRAALKVPESATALAPRLLPVLRRRRLQDARRALRRRAQPLRPGPHARLALQLSPPRRAHQPPRHARQGRPARSHRGLHRHRRLRLPRPLLHRPPRHPRPRSRRTAPSTSTKATTKTTSAAKRHRRLPHRSLHLPSRPLKMGCPISRAVRSPEKWETTEAHPSIQTETRPRRPKRHPSASIPSSKSRWKTAARF